MRKIFNKKIGVLFFSLICACLVNAAPVKNENDLKCFRFDIDETAEEFEIDVRSNNEKCGGEPNVEPRLFSYIVNKKTGKLLTDSFECAEKQGIEWDGEYLPID